MDTTHKEINSDFELCQMHKRGDSKATTMLIQKYQQKIEKLVCFFLKTNNIQNGHSIMDELQSAAEGGLLKAANKYDATHNATLISYASKFVKSEILKAYKDYLKSYVFNGLEIRDQDYKFIKRLRKVINSNDNFPSIESIADTLSLSISDTKHLLELNQKMLELQSASGLYSKRKEFDPNKDYNNDSTDEEEMSSQEESKNPTYSRSLSINTDETLAMGHNINIKTIYTILNVNTDSYSKIKKAREIIIDVLEKYKESDRIILTDLLADPNLMVDKDLSFSTLSEKYGKKTRTIQKIETRFVRDVTKQYQTLK